MPKYTSRIELPSSTDWHIVKACGKEHSIIINMVIYLGT